MVLLAGLSGGCDESSRRASKPGGSIAAPDAAANPSPDAAPQADAGTTGVLDAGTPRPPPVDGGTTPPPPADSGTTTPVADSGTPQPPPIDAGTPTPPPADAGFPTTPSGVGVLGNGQHTISSVNLTVIADANVGHVTPTDLAFNPLVPNQLWVVNQGDNSVWIATDVGSPSESAVWRQEPQSGRHFLAKPSSLAFGMNGAFATAQDEDQVTQASTPADFMGPTLWTSNLSIFNAGHAGHLDMLHNSPSGKGIAWERDNVYWYFDGAHGAITRYDFHADHNPGGTDHSDGEIARFAEGQVQMDARAASHMDIDHTSGLLYIADTGNNRIGILDTQTGQRGGSIGPNYDGCVMYSMGGATVTTLIDGATHGLVKPSGLELHDNMIFISDHATSKLYAFNKQGQMVDWLDTGLPANALMGFDFDPQGRLYFVDSSGNQILRIAPR